MGTTSPRPLPPVAWHGTQAETHDLFNAIARNCACGITEDGTRAFCAPHRMLLEDQRALDGLLFARRTRDRWTAAESRVDGQD